MRQRRTDKLYLSYIVICANYFYEDTNGRLSAMPDKPGNKEKFAYHAKVFVHGIFRWQWEAQTRTQDWGKA